MTHKSHMESGRVVRSQGELWWVMWVMMSHFPYLSLGQVLSYGVKWYRVWVVIWAMGHSSDLLGLVVFLLVCYRVVLQLELNFSPNKIQAWQHLQYCVAWCWISMITYWGYIDVVGASIWNCKWLTDKYSPVRGDWWRRQDIPGSHIA